jgi:hypothetical protein
MRVGFLRWIAVACVSPVLIAPAARAEPYESPRGDVNGCGDENGLRSDVNRAEETFGRCLAPRERSAKLRVEVRPATRGAKRVRATGDGLTVHELACLENRIAAEWIDRADAACAGAVSFSIPSGPRGGGQVDVAAEPVKCEAWSPAVAAQIESIAGPAKRCFAMHAPEIEGVFRVQASVGLLRGGGSMSQPGSPLPAALVECLGEAVSAAPVKLSEGARCWVAVAVRHVPEGAKASGALEAVVREAPAPEPQASGASGGGGGGGGGGGKGVSFSDVNASGACNFLGVVAALGGATKAVDRCIPSGGTWQVKMKMVERGVSRVDVAPPSKVATCIGSAIKAVSFPASRGPCDISFEITR